MPLHGKRHHRASGQKLRTRKDAHPDASCICDVLACGGFLLTNAQSELPDCFSIGEDLDCFSCEDDLLAKVEYYLSHDKDRAEIAHNGFEKVQKYHTYPERLLQMIALAYGLS